MVRGVFLIQSTSMRAKGSEARALLRVLERRPKLKLRADGKVQPDCSKAESMRMKDGET